MKNLIVFFGISLIASCDACGQVSKNNTDSLSEAKAVVTKFYSWYINDIYKNTYGGYLLPRYKKVKNQTYVFDEKELSDKLNKISYLSTNYKNRLMEKLRLCNQEVSKIKWESKPESQFNSKNCGYLWFDNWVGGQGEDIDGFKIIAQTDVANSTKFTVQITINGNPFTKSEVEVIRVDSAYKISSISLNWEK